MRLLDIHPGERLKTGMAWSLNGLLAAGHALGWAAVQAIIVKRAGVEAMPWAYVFANLLGLVSSLVYMRFADAMRRDVALVRSALILGAALAIAWFLGHSVENNTGLSWQLYAFFAAGVAGHGLTKSTLKAQAWTLFSDIFRPSQGRRLYPIITTSKAIGGLAGGLLVGPVTAAFGLESCMLAWAGAIFLVLPMTALIVRHFGAELHGGAPKPGGHHAHHAKEIPTLREGLLYCVRSPLVGLLALMTLTYWLCDQIHVYQYTQIMNISFAKEDSLGRWFGYYTAGFNVVCLLTQLFVAPRLLNWLGVGRTLLTQPLVGLAGFGAVLASFTFWPGLFLRATWDISEDAFHHSAFQLAFNAVPGGWRGRARGFVEGIINPVGGMLGGLLIVALRVCFGIGDSVTEPWNYHAMTLIGLAVAAVYLALATRARHTYVNAAIENLSHPDRRTLLDSVEALEERGHPVALAKLESLADSSDAAVMRLALRSLARVHHSPVIARVFRLLDDTRPYARETALHAARAFRPSIARKHPQEWTALLGKAEGLLASDPEAAVRAEAAHLLLEHSTDTPRVMDFVQGLFNSPDARTRALAAETLGVVRPRGAENLLRPLLNDTDPQARASAAAALWRTNPAFTDEAEETLRAMLAAPSSEEKRAALKVAARLPTDTFAPIFANLIENSSDKTLALASMALLATGRSRDPIWPRAVSHLATALTDPASEPTLRDHLVPMFGELPEDALDALLASAAYQSPAQRDQAARILHELYPALLKTLAHE